jgi:apolipoprotein D and lipocalin family protein
MTQRPRSTSARAAPAVRPAPFDDRRTSHAIGVMATAFVVGGVATWLALGAARTARAQPAG